MNTTIIDVLIENITTDNQLLDKADKKIEDAKDEKREIIDRIKDSKRDISVMLKYADEIQRKKIEDLGFDLSESDRGMNSIAAFAFETILKVKDNELSNAALYDAYVTSCKGKKEEAVNYTAFNIKCRTLFNTQKLLRKKGSDPKSSREDIISLNGRVVKKGESTPEKKDGKKNEASKKQEPSNPKEK